MSTFRDAIADTVAYAPAIPDFHEQNRSDADAILAMPEMQAIRKALRSLTVEHGFGAVARQTELLRRCGLPESVIDWVLEDQ